jgi:hypothetical protein
MTKINVLARQNLSRKSDGRSAIRRRFVNSNQK